MQGLRWFILSVAVVFMLATPIEVLAGCEEMHRVAVQIESLMERFFSLDEEIQKLASNAGRDTSRIKELREVQERILDLFEAPSGVAVIEKELRKFEQGVEKVQQSLRVRDSLSDLVEDKRVFVQADRPYAMRLPEGRNLPGISEISVQFDPGVARLLAQPQNIKKATTYLEAMEKGVVTRAQGQAGLKRLSNLGGNAYEVKVQGEYGDFRLLGCLVDGVLILMMEVRHNNYPKKLCE